MKEEYGYSAGRHKGSNHYVNVSTINKSNYNSNIADLEDAVFTQKLPSNAAKYKYLVNVLIN